MRRDEVITLQYSMTHINTNSLFFAKIGVGGRISKINIASYLRLKKVVVCLQASLWPNSARNFYHISAWTRSINPGRTYNSM